MTDAGPPPPVRPVSGSSSASSASRTSSCGFIEAPWSNAVGVVLPGLRGPSNAGRCAFPKRSPTTDLETAVRDGGEAGRKSYTGPMRARPQRILIERGGGPGGETLRAEIDPANMPPDIAAPISRLLDEARPPVADDEAGDTVYDIVLDYGDRRERVGYEEDERSGG